MPAYGSDLRPPVVAPPAVSAPTTPVSGAPVAPSPSTSPSAGSPLMSTVQRGAAAQAGGSAATPAGASALSAATGALAGDVSSRAAEQQRLQRLVDSVARQAPGLSWAAGLRDDGTTLLVCSIGCGWIPPNVKIPVGVNRLLDPAPRRPDADVVDLLGTVTAVAVHKAHGFIAKPGPDDPPLTGDRLARTGPEVEELGPTLVEAVRRRDGLPRIAQTLAQAATRGTGVTENEVDALQRELQAAYHNALEDPHDLSRTADWMLLSAVKALVEGHEWLAHYHVAWYIAISAKLG
ncbi:Tat (twin-arginine translocation) pathway signal sequence [Mycobacterium sp. 1245805.9]|nr:Tat (twin-arginine translocation) pathway signal sequence [Mycobacterium sp. 1245805.9]